MPAEPAAIDVLMVLAPRCLLLDLAGPAEAFRLANLELQRLGMAAGFRLRFVSARPSIVSSVGACLDRLEPLPLQLQTPSWVFLIGQPSGLVAEPDEATRETVEWLRGPVARALGSSTSGHRLVTICSGTLLAARADLLGHWRCTTHHGLLDLLRALAPGAQVVDNRVFVVDGPVASSAGVTAGIDLALHLIAETSGDRIAASVAQDMVVYLRRTPNDPELSPLLAHRHHLHPAVHRVQDAVVADPSNDWDMAMLASVAHVTRRHLLRLFSEYAGTSPLAYVERIRLEQARRCLAGGASVTRAAELAGFASDLRLRRAWSRHFPGTPRDAFAKPAGSGP